MVDQYGLSPEDYINDLKLLSNNHYILGRLILDPSFSTYLLKHFQATIATLMVYDFIYHIPQQVNLPIFQQ